MRHENMSRRLLASFAGIAALAAVTAGYSAYEMRVIRSDSLGHFSAASKHLDLSREVTIGMANMRSAMRGQSLFGIMHNPEGVAKANATFAKCAAQLRNALDEYAASVTDASDGAQLQTIRTGLEQWTSQNPHNLELINSGKAEEASAWILRTLSPVMDRMQTAAAALGESNRKRFADTVEETHARTQRAEYIALALAAAALV